MSTSLVVDASLTVKLILPNPEQVRCRELLAEWEQEGVYLTEFWTADQRLVKAVTMPWVHYIADSGAP